MKGIIYIAGAFQNLKATDCIIEGEIDNDPHIWTKPYTWGICRPDLRERICIGDYVFFVLSANANLPQMIFSYIKVAKIITHKDAYFEPELRSKRMANKKYNGNIIVDENGDYNRFDLGIHRHNFERIKKRYVVADMSISKKLSGQKIIKESAEFVNNLKHIFEIKSKVNTPIDIISRYGKSLTEIQVHKLIDLLN